MSITVNTLHGTQSDGDGEMTEEQVDLLLAQATRRLQEKDQISFSKQPESSRRFNLPQLDTGVTERSNLVTKGHLVKVRSTQDQTNRTDGIRKVEDPVTSLTLAKEKKKATAGPGWFDLPKTKLTPEFKRDLQLIKMRNVLDPHRHYKKDNGKMAAPEYSMIGTIQEGATEYFSSRIENKKRKRTFVEQVLSGEQETGRFKKKYGDVQSKKSSGKKTHYKDIQARRKSGVKKGG